MTHDDIKYLHELIELYEARYFFMLKYRHQWSPVKIRSYRDALAKLKQTIIDESFKLAG